MTISINVEKAFDIIQHPFMILKMNKKFRKLGLERNYLNLINNIYKKPIGNIILNSERLNAFPVRLPTCSTAIAYSTRILVSKIRQNKAIKDA